MMNEGTVDPADATLTAPPTNPHVLWRQLVGLVIWVSAICWFAGGPMVVAFGLLLGGVTFADAWTSGIYKKADAKGFLNISPMTWGIVMVGLFIVAFPLYTIKRNSLRTCEGSNGFFIALLALGAFAIAAVVVRAVQTA